MTLTSNKRQAPETTVGRRQPPSNAVGVAVLGSTGSIGRQTLDVVAQLPERFRIVALAAGANHELLAEQVRQFQPDVVARDDTSAGDLGPTTATCLSGSDGLIAAATHPDADIVVVATSGHAAIMPTYRAIEAGKTIALANKETIVCAGELIMPLAARHGVEIRPVDSEHSAIWQALGAPRRDDVARLILTASGGPFRTTPREQLASVTAEEALAHPTWRMGGKITIDSATLMNKGLELIEAHWLFAVPYDNIDVLVHPESIVHSIVEFVDGSQLAQLSLPDMRLPIQYALTYPEHASGPCRRLDLAEVGALHFERPDLDCFPALTLARRAGEQGMTYPTVLSAADEVAVEAFLAGRIPFLGIAAIVNDVLDAHTPSALTDVAVVFEADAWARRMAANLVSSINR
ncbi:MAG: 1-deoxy-D-xylulose-5-phosphate reductoisomerase [Thermomicrobiales bacterium]|nr:1-deoxy-D-xylulose-5-phosphate reductoisomerase [Thermomicrobiales bacterium]MEA2524437.1 1-deoxy-D-xylulose-5-phosphate reductoisomerase [Thermomicrobiales bacterium]MEA2528781.1 1-deoxy-D-xylulose-5-phosphate reductoisomerase [Thermomicrobiales bacterium]